MITVVLENAPPSLQGNISLWLTQIHPGTFVGDLNARTRDRLWDRIRSQIRTGTAIMAWTERNHLHILTENPKLKPVDNIGQPLTKLCRKP